MKFKLVQIPALKHTTIVLFSFFLVCCIFSGYSSAENTHEKHPHAIILTDKHDFILDDQGLLTETWRRRVQVFSENGIDMFADVRVFYNSLEESLDVVEAFTLNSRGEKIPVPDTAINRTLPFDLAPYPAYGDFRILTVSFVGIDKGSILEMKLERTRLKEPDYPWWEKQIHIGDETFIESLDISVVCPPGSFLASELIGKKLDPAKSESDGLEVLTWRFEDIEPILYESNTGGYYDLMPVLCLSTCPSWEKAAAELKNRFYAGMSESTELKEKAIALTEEALGPAAVINALYDYCRDTFRSIDRAPHCFHYKTESLENILNRNYGHKLDQALLFSAMLKECGGAVSLIASSGAKHFPNNVAGLSFFDDILIQVQLKDEKTLLDFESSPGFWNPFKHPDRKFLAVLDDGLQWKETPGCSPESNHAELELDITIDRDKNVTGSFYIVLQGFFSPFRQIRKDTQSFIKDELNSLFDEAETEEYRILWNKIEKCSIAGKFKAKMKTESLNEDYEIQRFPVLPVVAESLPEPLPVERTHPFQLNCCFTEKTRLAIKLPQNWTIAKPPKNVSFENDFVKIETSFDPNSDKKIWERTMSIRQDVVPSEDYNEYLVFNAFFRKLDYNGLIYKLEND